MDSVFFIAFGEVDITTRLDSSVIVIGTAVGTGTVIAEITCVVGSASAGHSISVVEMVPIEPVAICEPPLGLEGQRVNDEVRLGWRWQNGGLIRMYTDVRIDSSTDEGTFLLRWERNFEPPSLVRYNAVIPERHSFHLVLVEPVCCSEAPVRQRGKLVCPGDESRGEAMVFVSDLDE